MYGDKNIKLKRIKNKDFKLCVFYYLIVLIYLVINNKLIVRINFRKMFEKKFRFFFNLLKYFIKVIFIILYDIF